MESKSDQSHIDSMDALHDRRVDWALVADEVHCPLCEYNLRGLIDPRCPECGYQFEWRDLLDSRRRLHPYLFEQQKRGKRFASFWKTAWHGLLPWKFWSTLRADQPPSVKWLAIYWLAATVFAAVALASSIALGVVNVYIAQRNNIGFFAAAGRTWPFLFNALTEVKYEAAYFAFPILITLSWPLLSFASLLVLQASMRRARIGPAHVWRCVVYSWDIAIFAGIVLALLNIARGSTSYHSNRYSLYYARHDIDIFAGVVIIISVLRLAFAYSRYLKFRHVVPTVLATQVITLLILLAMLRVFLPVELAATLRNFYYRLI